MVSLNVGGLGRRVIGSRLLAGTRARSLPFSREILILRREMESREDGRFVCGFDQ